MSFQKQLLQIKNDLLNHHKTSHEVYELAIQNRLNQSLQSYSEDLDAAAKQILHNSNIYTTKRILK